MAKAFIKGMLDRFSLIVHIGALFCLQISKYEEF